MNYTRSSAFRWGAGLVGLLGLLAVAGCSLLPGPAAPPALPPPPTATPAVVATVPPLPAGTVPPDAANPPPPDSGEPLVARVNGQPIPAAVYEKQVQQYEQALVAQGLDLDSEEGQATLIQIRRQVLEGLIDQALIEQAAAAQGIFVSDETLESKVQETIALGQDQQQFEAWLAANNLTLDDFKESLRAQLLTAEMFEHVTAGVQGTAEQVHVRHIQVADEATARDILAQLNAGANFADLAQAYSQDEGSRPNGGDLGWFPRGLQLISPEIEAAAFELQPGQVSDVIQTQFGFHVLKVENRETARPLTPEMLTAVKSNVFNSWLAQQKAAAQIERFLEI